MNTITALVKELYGLLKWLISLLGPIPSLIRKLVVVLAVLLALIPFVSSLIGVDELAPLFAYFMILFVVLLLVQTLLIPFLTSLRKHNPLPNFLKSLKFVVLRLAFYGGLLLGGLWSLDALGLLEDFLALLDKLPTFTVPSFDVVVPGAIILLLLASIFIIFRPAFARS